MCEKQNRHYFLESAHSFSAILSITEVNYLKFLKNRFWEILRHIAPCMLYSFINKIDYVTVVIYNTLEREINANCILSNSRHLEQCASSFLTPRLPLVQDNIQKALISHGTSVVIKISKLKNIMSV